MFVVEADLSETKLDELLAEAHESSALDYKCTCDLSSTADVVEVTKDLGAMMIEGGFILIGCDDSGVPSPRFTSVSPPTGSGSSSTEITENQGDPDNR